MVNQKREDALLDEAYFKIKCKEFNNAKSIFDKIFALNPNNPNAIVGKAYCFYRQLNRIQAYKLCKDINILIFFSFAIFLILSFNNISFTISKFEVGSSKMIVLAF